VTTTLVRSSTTGAADAGAAGAASFFRFDLVSLCALASGDASATRTVTIHATPRMPGLLVILVLI
jgi:hypothetical protein